MSSRVFFDELRTLGFASISAAYASVGASLTKPARAVCFTNNTEGDMLLTTDTDEDQIIVLAGSFKLWDLQSNINPQFDDKCVLPVGTQFSVKQLTAPVSGSVYIEIIY